MTNQEGQSELSDLISLPNSKITNEKIKEILRFIISDGVNYSVDVLSSITLLLDSEDRDIQCLSAQSIAELCKCEKKRISYTQNDIVKKLLDNLKLPLVSDNLELIKQSCRGLGNICYDSYIGRDLVLNSGGIPIIVNLLPETLANNGNEDDLNYNVRLYACKLLFILVLGGSEYIKPALDADFLKKIHEVIKYEFTSQCGDDDRLHTALLIMSVITEYTRSLVIDEELTLLIVDILKTVKNMEISEVCLDYLHYQAEHDEVKTVLAKAAVPQILWNLLEKHKTLAVDEESRELMKLACDLIALILTGDASMNLLYDDGKGDFYLSMIKSLNSEDIELSITAILAIGNFARTDTHCMQMMDTGVFSKLMSILVSHKNQEDDIRLQHVVLSGLRNLVIPQRNKSLAVQLGILPILIEMIPIAVQYHVVFKLLATLRMLVDGQESVAEDLVASNVLDRVAKWGLQTEHNGVSGEASRLLARIVRQLQSPNSLIKIIQVTGCICCLVNMLTASHAIMQNEAIIALTVLSAICYSEKTGIETSGNILESNNISSTVLTADQVSQTSINANEMLSEELIKSDLAKQLNVLLEKNADKIQSEIAENLCKFLSLVISNKRIVDQIYEHDSMQLLQKLTINNSNLNDKAKTSIENIICEINLNKAPKL